jgi:hypothetical protein
MKKKIANLKTFFGAKVAREQGDQIGRIFAYWVTFFLG